MSTNPSLLGRIAAAILALLPRRSARPTGRDYARADFPTSTSRIGVTFNDRIRNVFRFKWIRRHSTPPDERDHCDDR